MSITAAGIMSGSTTDIFSANENERIQTINEDPKHKQDKKFMITNTHTIVNPSTKQMGRDLLNPFLWLNQTEILTGNGDPF